MGAEVTVMAPSDEDLIASVGSGDVDSLGVLVGRWEQPLFRFVVRLTDAPDEARDLCQETFLRIMDGAPRFRKGARFSTWMYQIALNLCRDRARRAKRWSRRLARPPASDGTPRAEPIANEASPEETIGRLERLDAVRRALDELPADHREVIVLKEYEGLKFREIAEILRVPESTVKSRMYVALNTMKDTLVRQGVR